MPSTVLPATLTLLILFAESASGAASRDPVAGKVIFEGKGGCLECHSVGNRGGSLGPELNDIGVMRTEASLRLALTDPDAEISREYFTITLVTKEGMRIEGVRLNEDDFSIQLRDVSGTPRSFLKDSLKDLRREVRSLMPSYAARLSARELDDVVAYLGTLKGAIVRPVDVAARAVAPVSERLDWLTRPDRDADERPNAVLDALQIRKGAAVAEVGAGAGYFTWRLAERVGPGGKVIAVEIQRKMLDLIAEDLKRRGIANVELVLGNECNPRLPEGTLDLVLLANAYHEFSQPKAMMAAIARSLKPDGRLAVLEYRKENAYTPIEPLHKMTVEELRSEIEPLGFETAQVLDILPLQHLVIFTKRVP